MKGRERKARWAERVCPRLTIRKGLCSVNLYVWRAESKISAMNAGNAAMLFAELLAILERVR
jgi:hypothetical protein